MQDSHKIGCFSLFSCFVVSALCDPMDCSTPAFPVLHYLLQLAQTHVHWIGDAIQPPHTLSPPSPLALSLSKYQGLFQSGSSSLQMAKALELQFQHQFFQWIFQVDFLLRLTCLISSLSKGLSRVFSSTTIRKHQFFGALPFYDPALTLVHNYGKNHSLDLYGSLSSHWYLYFLIHSLGLP